MADLYVNSDELKEVASSMKLKANNIMEAYQNDASTAILSGSESIQISGLDTTQVLNSFNKIFTNLSTRINTLSEFLINTVANEYDNVSASIKNEFDNEFANELAKLLGLTVGTGTISGSITTPTTPTYPTPATTVIPPVTSNNKTEVINIEPNTGSTQTNNNSSNSTPPTSSFSKPAQKPAQTPKTETKPKVNPYIGTTGELKPGFKNKNLGDTIYAYSDTGTGGKVTPKITKPGPKGPAAGGINKATMAIK